MIRNRVVAIALSLLTLIGLVMVSPNIASASARSDQWRARAITALDKFLATTTAPDMPSFAYGMAAGAAGYLYGWDDPITTDLLAQLRATKNPDGTYGLNEPRDVFNDGTVNSATTGYAVTIAGHVGPTLLEAYKHGAATAAEIQVLVNALAKTFPKVTGITRGQCIAYSNSPYDKTHCVHNVNSGVAWFLMEANALGFGATGMQNLITNISIAEGIAYRETQWWWPYSDSGANADADHASYEAEAMYRLQYWVGREAAYRMMIKNWTDNDQGPIVHTRLIGLPGGVGSDSGDTTLWCVMGDSVSAEQDAYLASITGGDRAAQFAYYAARNSVACA